MSYSLILNLNKKMKILDYIFKSRAQREKGEKETEAKRSLELSSLANKLYKEKKDDECLKVCMELVNKDFCGLGFWSVYLFATEILYEKKRYKDILEVSMHYKRFYDCDSDRHMDWYESMARRAIYEQEHPKSVPKPQSINISTPTANQNLHHSQFQSQSRSPLPLNSLSLRSMCRSGMTMKWMNPSPRKPPFLVFVK